MAVQTKFSGPIGNQCQSVNGPRLRRKRRPEVFADRNLNVFTFFETHIIAMFVGEGIFNTQVSGLEMTATQMARA
jgi:hypothetical protein